MSRGMSALLGAILLAAGVAGLSTVSLATPAGAQVSQGDAHDLMHEMMDQCAAMMAMMGSGMMGGEMTEMMDEMTGMMRD